MITVSLCMIVKNEEDVLERCLASAAPLADEIIIVDTGSTDATKEIAAKYTVKVFDYPWQNDFAAARNYSFAQASMEYCLWLDADDMIPEKEAEKFLQLKQTLPDHTNTVMMKYHYASDAYGNPTQTFFRERLIRNIPELRWQGFIHEYIQPFGNVIYADIAILHLKEHSVPMRNLEIYNQKINEGVKLSPRDQFYYAKELYYNQNYICAAAQFNAFLEGNQGWVENNIEACRYLSYCYTALQQPEQALRALFSRFIYDIPQAETCCDIGKYFIEKKAYAIAAFWYQTALEQEPRLWSGAFISPDCYTYIPCIALCMCHYFLGDTALAIDYNERAGTYKPYGEEYLYNKNFFSSLTYLTPEIIEEE